MGHDGGLLNYAPYVGPLIGIVAMLLMVSPASTRPARAVPAAIYLGPTRWRDRWSLPPIVLGRRMALSPLVLILALMVFGWLWGLGRPAAGGAAAGLRKIIAGPGRRSSMDGWAKLLE